MHVETSRSHQVLRDGTERTYERHLLRRSFRDGGKVRKETLANLSHLPPEAIAAVRAVLAGQTLIDAGAAFEVTRSLPHGHAAAVHAMARRLGFPALLGPPGPHRDLAYALIISRVLRPASKLSTAGWWDDVTLGPDLGVAGASGEQLVVLGDVRHGPGAGGKRGELSRAVQGPVHGGPADAEQGGDPGHVVIAAVVHAADLAVLGGLEPGLLAAQLAVLAGDGHALAGALADQVGP